MLVVVAITVNTLIIAALLVWLSRGGGKVWVNDINTTSLSTIVALIVLLETAGVVLGVYLWANLNGFTSRLDRSMGYLGVWLGFVAGTVLVNSGTTIFKRTTSEGYVEKKGAAKAAVEAARSTSVTNGLTTKEHAALVAQPAVAVGHADTVTAASVVSPALAGVDDSRVDDER